MGQYYKPIILAADSNKITHWWYSWDFENGLKLMEHSYVGNTFVHQVSSFLFKNPQRLVWAGDYADPEVDLTEEINLYSLAKEDTKVNRVIEFDVFDAYAQRYLINHSKQEYVDLKDEPKDKDGWRIHALPLLTSEGNGRGGGDFHPRNNFVGRWARDIVSVSDSRPLDCKLIKPRFKE